MIVMGGVSQPPTGHLEDEVRNLHAIGCAIHSLLLERIAELSRRDAYRQDGARDMAGWLVATLGVSLATARAWVQTASALEDLPAIASRLADGDLSVDQTAVLARFATPADDDVLADEARGWSVSQLEHRAARERRLREETCAAPADPVETTWLRTRRTARNTMRLSAELPLADGRIVTKALERGADQMPVDPETGDKLPFRMRMAHALVEVCSVTIADDADADRAIVVLYADTSALRGGNGLLELEDGSPLSLSAAMRMTCDCLLETVVTDGCGHPIGIGRASRVVPRWMRRQVMKRHGHRCRFPGCERTRWIECHHVIPWELGGPTDLDNLIPLCRPHHNHIHDLDWQIVWKPDWEPLFLKPDGTPYEPRPPALKAEHRAWVDRIEKRLEGIEPDLDDTS